MRDQARIDDVLEEIRKTWIESPDLRLGQLVVNAVRPAQPCPELFGMEDHELLKAVRRLKQQMRTGQLQRLDTEASFEVEASLEIGGRGYVFARVLSDVEFEVLDGATLGDVSIERWLEQPRALQEDGAPRTDLFAFCLADVQDLAKFNEGMLVTLRCHQSGS